MDLSINQRQIEPESVGEVAQNDEEKHVEQDETPQKHWARKKHKKYHYEQILKQMEFYFSPANLAKDRYMSQLIQEDPCKSIFDIRFKYIFYSLSF